MKRPKRYSQGARSFNTSKMTTSKIVGCCVSLLIVSLACKHKKEVAESTGEVDNYVGVTFVNDEADQKVVVSINGKMFTNYRYDDRSPKPILYPILTSSGQTVTRGFPYEPRPHERVDHPHHSGLWLNYGDVNGLDFWNNSYAIPEAEKHKYGTIHHDAINQMDEQSGVLSVKASWRTPDGADLLEETTQFRFAEEGTTRIIDRITTLKALTDVSFKDNKEGMIGIRVARELELPSDKPATYTDAQGKVTQVQVLNNDGVTGDYLGSTGLTGAEVWGTRNKWVKLEGVMDGDPVSITIIDHRENVGYPTYWHARGYGLFAANPLGQAIFSEGSEVLDFALKEGSSTTFKYRVLIHNGASLSKEEIQRYALAFNE